MIIRGVDNSNARVGLGGTRAFTLIVPARPQNGQRRAGKKERSFRSVGPQGIFARPAKFSAEFLPAAFGGGLKVGVGIFLVESSNFF